MVLDGLIVSVGVALLHLLEELTDIEPSLLELSHRSQVLQIGDDSQTSDGLNRFSF